MSPAKKPRKAKAKAPVEQAPIASPAQAKSGAPVQSAAKLSTATGAPANLQAELFDLEELIKVLIEDGVIVKGQEFWQIVPHRV